MQWCSRRNVMFPQSHSHSAVCIFHWIYEFVRVWTPPDHLFYGNTKPHDTVTWEFTNTENTHTHLSCWMGRKEEEIKSWKCTLNCSNLSFHWMNYNRHHLESASMQSSLYDKCEMWSEPDCGCRLLSRVVGSVWKVVTSLSRLFYHTDLTLFPSFFLVQWKLFKACDNQCILLHKCYKLAVGVYTEL